MPSIDRDNFDAVLFDLDGVITQTASLHGRCWKEMFDEFLQRRAQETGGEFVPFDIATDYRVYVDGKPRYDGVRSFLASRGVELPEGKPDESGEADTICGLGNRKDKMVKEAVARGEVESYPSSIEFLRTVRKLGFATAVVSSSKNCEGILLAAGIDDAFDVRVDGVTAAEMGLAGKPAPDTFLKAANMLEIDPARGIVIEDAIAGVQAGRAGDFGLVIGVDRMDQADALRENGADQVVTDLGELLK